MPKIPDDIIKRIEETARIEEVVGDCLGWHPATKGGLRKTGVRYTAICPFHDDRTDGNFIVYPKGNCYRCFTCDAKGGAVQFLMDYLKLSFVDAIRWLGKKYNIEVDNIPIDYVPPPPREIPPPLPTLIIPRELVAKRTGHLEGDPLYKWLKSIHWDTQQASRIDTILHDYCVGHVAVIKPRSRHEFTAFWQIDHHGNPRTAHYMKYKPNGHRYHKDEDRYNTDWFHSLLERNNALQYFNPETHEARQCLFGEHLLNRFPDAPVCIVESEKTALIMAIAYDNNMHHLWMACCGSSNITRERLQPIIEQERRIILYPDRDGIAKWQAKAANIHYPNITVDTTPVERWWKPCDVRRPTPPTWWYV